MNLCKVCAKVQTVAKKRKKKSKTRETEDVATEVAAPPRIGTKDTEELIKLLIEKLSPYTATTRLSLGKGIYAWRCYKPVPTSHKPSSTVFIWYEDGKGQLPGDPEPKVNVSIPTKAASARLVRIITEPDKRTASAKPIAVNDGNIVLSVGETPLLIEE